MKRLDEYFKKCIKDAYASEEREYKETDKISWYYVITTDNQILFSINTPFARVSRKACNRIRNNVTKNFGLYCSNDYFMDTIMQPNFVCNHFVVGTDDLFLCKRMDMKDIEQGEVIGSGRYEKLCKAFYGASTEEFKENHDNLHLPYDISWESYRETYLKAYGKYPEIEIKDMGGNIKND